MTGGLVGEEAVADHVRALEGRAAVKARAPDEPGQGPLGPLGVDRAEHRGPHAAEGLGAGREVGVRAFGSGVDRRRRRWIGLGAARQHAEGERRRGDKRPVCAENGDEVHTGQPYQKENPSARRPRDGAGARGLLLEKP